MVPEAQTGTVRQEKEMKGLKWGREEVSLSLCEDEMMLSKHYRSQAFHQKSSRNYKQVQHCGRLQNQLAQINSFSVYQQQTHRGDQGHIPIHNNVNGN